MTVDREAGARRPRAATMPGEAHREAADARPARWNDPRCPTWLWADEGELVEERPMCELATRIQGGTDFVAMDCRIRATSPETPPPAGPNTHVIPSPTTAPPDRSGREAEHSVGVIHTPGWAQHTCLPCLCTAPPGGSGREAEHSAGVIYSRSIPPGSPHVDARPPHRLLGRGDRVAAVMEDRGGEGGVGAALDDALGEVLEGADAAGGDHRDRDRVGDGAGEDEVVAVLGAVAVHARQHDLAGAALGGLGRPGDRLAAVDPAAAPGDVDVPAGFGPGTVRASIATTTHWEPKTSASSPISSGRARAAELTPTLSAPASRTA